MKSDVVNVQSRYELRNGTTIPCVGVGTLQIEDDTLAVNTVKEAIAAGYRHIDTATRYENETSVGKALAQCGVKREELFVTSKVWTTERGYEKTLKAFEASLKMLDLEYLDLYLIHWPAVRLNTEDWIAVNRDTWRALETLYKEGYVKAIGVSNFLEHHLQPLLDDAEILPMVDQIESHPGYTQDGVVKYCQRNGILVEAWGPFGSGAMLSHPVLTKMAEKYGKTVAQLILRWDIQRGVVPLPKTITPERMRSNMDVFDFVISEEDMETLTILPVCGWSGAHPDAYNE